MSDITNFPDALQSLAARWAQYEKVKISRETAPSDDMLSGASDAEMAAYLKVGRSALNIIAAAMLSSGKTEIGSILDLPCGGGRVTRHLRAFFPEASITVSDLEQSRERFAAKKFSAKPLDPPDAEFLRPLPPQFDLIFCGSLLTHFHERRFRRCVRWMADATLPNGLIVLTLHGRYCDFYQRNRFQMIEEDRYKLIYEDYQKTGFGYEDYPGQDYGISLTHPAWVFRMLDGFEDLRLLTYGERAWNMHQDALVLIKAPLNT